MHRPWAVRAERRVRRRHLHLRQRLLRGLRQVLAEEAARGSMRAERGVQGACAVLGRRVPVHDGILC